MLVSRHPDAVNTEGHDDDLTMILIRMALRRPLCSAMRRMSFSHEGLNTIMNRSALLHPLSQRGKANDVEKDLPIYS